MNVLLIGKGPSAKTAPSQVIQHRERGNSIAVVNDSLRLFEGLVDYGYIMDVELMDRCREHWCRVREWVCPDCLHKDYALSNEATLPHGFPPCSRFSYRVTLPDDFAEAVRSRVICQYNTATIAMSSLAYKGYQRIYLLGFDGGTGFANDQISSVHPGFNYDNHRDVQLKLVEVLKSVMGVESIWLI